MKNKISAKIVADSINPQGNRITSYILTYPRFIHAELMTHRMFSRNSASSRAIPFKKMLQSVGEDPFIPIAWQKDHSGMQGTEYFEDEDSKRVLKAAWLSGADSAIASAKALQMCNVTKQLCNRLLEPFLWHTVLVTATEWENFFDLRCPKIALTDGEICRSRRDALTFSCGLEDPIFYNKVIEYTDLDWIKESKSGAEIHIQALAEAMWDAIHESTPTLLDYDQWHIPFGDKIDLQELKKLEESLNTKDRTRLALSVATARCARVSYMTFDGVIDYAKDITMHDSLLANKHASPFEHCAKAMSDLEYYSFIKGKIPTTEDSWGIVNYDYYPITYKAMFEGDKVGINEYNDDRFGWCNNFKGFIPYRYLIENDKN
jgi:thymidylate synthase ThyX